MSNLQQGTAPNDNYYLTFSDNLALFSLKLAQLKQALLDHIFDWTMSLKHDRPAEHQMEEYQHRSESLATEMETQLYYFIPNILVNIERDREDLRRISEFFEKNYENYLGTYYSVKEVQLYHSKQSHIELVIEN